MSDWMNNGHYFAVAERRGGPGWAWTGWKVIGDDGDILVTGQRGDKTTSFAVSKPEAEAERDRFAREVGCAVCMATGKLWDGWSQAEGNRYRKCNACAAASGRAEAGEGQP